MKKLIIAVLMFLMLGAGTLQAASVDRGPGRGKYEVRKERAKMHHHRKHDRKRHHRKHDRKHHHAKHDRRAHHSDRHR